LRRSRPFFVGALTTDRLPMLLHVILPTFPARSAQKPQFAPGNVLAALLSFLSCHASHAAKGCLRTIQRMNGGGGGIRTHETLSGLTVFKTAAFNRSATPPKIKSLLHCSLGTARVTVLDAPEVLRRTLLRIYKDRPWRLPQMQCRDFPVARHDYWSRIQIDSPRQRIA
jgi:hypothetical protein